MGDSVQSLREGGTGNSKRFLYLVLDNFFPGLSIYKIDTDILEPDGEDNPSCVLGFRHLPMSAALRLESAGVVGVGPKFVTTLGSRIFISVGSDRNCGDVAPTFIYDTKMAALSAGPILPERLHRPVCVPIAIGDDGEKLFVMSSGLHDHSCDLLTWCGLHDHSCDLLTWCKGWHVDSLAPPPFSPGHYVTSYAVDKDEHTIFISTKSTNNREFATYSFDAWSSKWTTVGNWLLPFTGQGFFDSKLDAWVRLDPDGYICTCSYKGSRIATPTSRNPFSKKKKIPTPSSSRSSPQLVFERTEEKLFQKDDDDNSIATLAPMGENKFCLVESVERWGLDLDTLKGCENDTDFLHLTTFSLRRQGLGHRNLQAVQHSTQSYMVSRFTNDFPLAAFVM